MNYIVTIGYEMDQLDRNGNVRLQKVKYLVEGESIEEATIVATNYKNEDRRESQILSITTLPVECILHKDITPKYYGNE
jgi:hypothetical protein